MPQDQMTNEDLSASSDTSGMVGLRGLRAEDGADAGGTHGDPPPTKEKSLPPRQPGAFSALLQ